MFSGLNEKNMAHAIEAMLFISDEPVNVISIASILECEPSLAEDALLKLQQELEDADSGIQLREVAGGWRLLSHPRYHELLEKYVVSWDTRKLSQAAMETLAIVAYTQPVTRSSVAYIRGVNSDSSINSLLDKGLIREAGVADAPGNPTLYATSKTFLEKFGLRSIKDLTDIEEFAPDNETKKLIADRLSATRADIGITDEDAQAMAQQVIESADIDDAANGQDGFEEESQAAKMIREALASTVGVVEKIDFDKIDFDFSDE